jgi:hypothetical protein
VDGSAAVVDVVEGTEVGSSLLSAVVLGAAAFRSWSEEQPGRSSVAVAPAAPPSIVRTRRRLVSGASFGASVIRTVSRRCDRAD